VTPHFLKYYITPKLTNSHCSTAKPLWYCL